MTELSAEVFRSDERPQGGAARAVQLAGDAIFFPYLARAVLLDGLAQWLVHRVIFRGGWTVYIDAPDRDPVKVRCADREEATVRARNW